MRTNEREPARTGGAPRPGDELLCRLGAQLHLRHLLRGQVDRVLDVQMRPENGFAGIALLLILPRLQSAFESLFEIKYRKE